MAKRPHEEAEDAVDAALAKVEAENKAMEEASARISEKIKKLEGAKRAKLEISKAMKVLLMAALAASESASAEPVDMGTHFCFVSECVKCSASYCECAACKCDG